MAGPDFDLHVTRQGDVIRVVRYRTATVYGKRTTDTSNPLEEWHSHDQELLSLLPEGGVWVQSKTLGYAQSMVEVREHLLSLVDEQPVEDELEVELEWWQK